MTTILCGFNALVFVALACLHIYWLAGGEWGVRQAVPEQFQQRYFERPLETKFATLLVTLGLFSFSAINLWMMPSVSAPGLLAPYLPVIILVIAVLFGLRGMGDFNIVGLFKKKRDSDFARMDSLLYSPLCLLLLATHLGIYFGY